jgi:DNA-binding GntR family transcriptional regulator
MAKGSGKAGAKAGEKASNSLSYLPVVERETLNDRVYREMRTMIMSGGFAPGEELTLRALAQALHVSLMPVRDAIGRLVVERALEMLPNRQVIVPDLSIDKFLEIRRVRILLEGEAAALAAQHATSDLVESLKGTQKKIISLSSNKQRQFFGFNREFHFAIYGAARSPLLLSMIESLWLQIGPVFNHIHLNFTSEGARGHERIISALHARDAKAARAAIVEDLTKGGDRIVAALVELKKQPQ